MINNDGVINGSISQDEGTGKRSKHYMVAWIVCVALICSAAVALTGSFATFAAWIGSIAFLSIFAAAVISSLPEEKKR